MPQTISFQYTPSKEYILYTLEQQPIVSIGNLTGITADIGVGKSQLCEILASYWINPTIALHDMQCTQSQGKCLYIDTERTPNDCYKGLLRIQHHTQYTQEDIQNKLRYLSTIDYSSAKEQVNYLRTSLEKYKDTQLVIIDTLLDFIMNANDLKESVQLCQDMIKLAQTYHVAIIYTLHGNRNDKSGKGKGHIGDVYQRKSECFLQLQDKKDKKILSSDFANGKVRNGYNKISTLFEWNIETNYLQECGQQQTRPEKNPFDLIFVQFNETFTYKELVAKYVEITKYSERTAGRRIKTAVEEGIIVKHYNMYSKQQ